VAPTVTTRRLNTLWRELGRLGRIAFAGVALSAAIAVALGVSIPQILRSHLIEERTTTVERIVAELVAEDILHASMADFSPLDEFVRLRLLGGDTVRVKVWSPDGVILWSDEPRLIGRDFPLSTHGARAFEGETSSHVSSLGRLEHEFEASYGRLIEFYVPIVLDEEVPYVFEVYQEVEPLSATVSRARRTVWLSIAVGLGTLGLFMVGVTAAVIASAERRRRQAERMLDRLAAVRDEERAALATAMHDDIGQPLYRLLYGLEALHTSAGDPASRSEIERLREVVGGVDAPLRPELRRPQSPVLSGDLHQALADLAQPPPADPHVWVTLDTADRPSQRAAEALYRATREALTNALRHADAGTISVSLTGVGNRLVSVVVDDGRGTAGVPGLGTTLVARTLADVDGEIATRARPGKGTTVTISVPIEERP
jgi:two-component system, NarL family, sensor kinase